MALKKYVGARYAPQFMGAWNQATQYAALSVVYTDQRSYVSRKTVPAGTEITNQEFWIQSSDWNAQVAQYNQKVDAYNTNVEKYNKNVEDYAAAVSAFYADTLHSYDTKADMQSDRTLKVGDTLLTCGGQAIGDGGGSFYQVVAETSVTAVALDNGLFAEPFEFQPYDFSQFQTEVEGYKKSTTRVYQNVEAMVADMNIGTGDTLMTNGKATPGDGKGRFWTVGDEATGKATRLNNGKYASPFQLASVETASMLVFNSTGAQPAIWGIKEGSDPVTIPMLLEEGNIKTVYVAVEYTTGGKGATVNLDISGTQSLNKTFAFNESAPVSGQYKTVLYAITGKVEGGSVYTGYTTLTSYNTTLEKTVEIITVGIPDNANSVWDDSFGSISLAKFTVTKPLTLTSFTINTYVSWVNTTLKQIQVLLTKPNSDSSQSNFNLFTTSVAAFAIGQNINKTFKCNVPLNPGIEYSLSLIYGTGSISLPPNVTGNYGPFTFNDGKYSGLFTYTED